MRARPLIALAVALALGGWLLAARPAHPPVPPPQPQAAKTPAPQVVAQRPATTPARLADGTAFTPQFYPDAATAIGTVRSPDASAERLVLVRGGAERELRRVPAERYPQFLGFAAADGVLYWAESTATTAGPWETRMWKASLDGGAPVSLTTDAGAAVFFDSQFDLVVAEGRLHWIAAPPDDSDRTELRSVALGGGKVTVESMPGRYRWTTWPWMQSADVQSGPVELVDRATGQRRTVAATAAETLGCTPAWCRSVAATASGNLFQVLSAEGGDRRRIPGEVNAVTVDVGLMDRYEVLTELADEKVRVLAYDLRDGTTKLLASDVGVVGARGPVVFWSTGAAAPETWNALDLRTLP
ncbi:hypothetical protein ACFFX1_46385 [Dactylosporangium sucinum]|uniref:Uncharacterized protein n=1 Tax=Dactylosporangium sucinum TaxID=1424081 RepID=A0A917TPJ6_9ACTN|nr:hypothetical protein [Dactylosporangium sucinum]GGM30663.1 hypothetical protein GCM10007977_034910 [Dactylosporangium sucinum]